ncbi:MAG TPA: class I SAM-dependent methyltransferase [Micropepsaceae bacterium]|nr:class I SAM-dependent methyltransferase [Micropepsaceae bacterium]
MTEVCDLCRSRELEMVYQPSQSPRALSIWLCTECGLLQSLPRAAQAPRREAAISAGADWGNVRYGKGFRTDACMTMVRALADFERPLSVLDVGSNRGAFARAFLESAPAALLTCVEPDERVATSCASLRRTELMQVRIEETRFPDEAFDIIHSCHTIEHLASPTKTLAEHWRSLKPGGLLVVDVPNTALLGAEDILEEWFIDKHLFHFSRATLARLIESCGFEIVGGPDPLDHENLLFAARKRNATMWPLRHDRLEVESALKLMTAYIANRARNLAALTHVASEIAALAPKRVALWGAGRLFDSLVQNGGFDPKSLALLIDTHLKPHVAERHGVKLAGADELARANPSVIVVMSRSFAGEIATVAKERAPKAKILLYSDLLARARTQLAA